MAEQSTLSDGATRNFLGEVSDANMSSSSSNHHELPGNHPTYSKFKGVVSQSNGHWGAQIYSKHHRIWLGTFKSEKEAAMAYDSAAILLRNGQFQQRNFPWTDSTVQEPNFQSQFTEEAVLSMIRDGSYAARFSEFVRSQEQQGEGQFLGLGSSPWSGMKITYLFEKELTRSDVSKLNRLVIPKRYAVKHLPEISEDGKNDKDSNSHYHIQLKLYDQMMRMWTFRYCYWMSSQSYVFTVGWNAFAKENRLRPGDSIVISSGECNDEKIFMIEVAYSDEAIPVPGLHSSGNVETGIMDAEIVEVQDDDDDCQVMEGFPMPMPDQPPVPVTGPVSVPEATEEKAKRGFKLFGVWIDAP